MLIGSMDVWVEEDEVEVWVVAAALIVRTRLATWVNPPPLPVTVSVYEAVDTSVGNVTVSVEAKFGVPDGLLKTPLAPEGNPETDNETCELKPLRALTFTEYDTVCPWSTVWEGGLALIAKSGAAETVRVTEVVWVSPPPLPTMVSVNVPGDTEDDTVTPSVEVNGGVPEVGLNDADTPVGNPDTLRATPCCGPLTGFTVTV
jgi:hypothetical protein